MVRLEREDAMTEYAPRGGRPPVAGRFEGPPPRRRRAPAALAFALLAVMLGSAFGLGVGVISAIDGGEPGYALRSPRGSTVPGQPRVAAPAATGQFAILDEVKAILEEEFVEPERLAELDYKRAAIAGILDALGDPHTTWIDPLQYSRTREDISGSFEGIGSTVDTNAEGEVFIVRPFEGSPAQNAGLRSGDVILAVDGESIAGWSLQQAVDRIRGPRGTDVTLTIRRDGGELDVTITRDRIIVPSVRTAQIQDRAGEPVLDIGYMLIQQFTNRTLEEVRELLQAAESAGIDKLIVDLRRNPGGLVSGTVDTTGEFLDGGVVMRQAQRDGTERVYRAEPGGMGLDFQLVVLIDQYSASGSEVMAAALRDAGRAVLIGQTTVGKGTVNIERPLSDQSILYVSIARWLTPERMQIEGVGVVPDIEIIEPEGGLSADNDLALFEAIDYLRGTGSADGADGSEENDDGGE